MGGLFGGKPPSPPKPQPSAQELQAQADEAARLRNSRGFASTFLSRQAQQTAGGLKTTFGQ